MSYQLHIRKMWSRDTMSDQSHIMWLRDSLVMIDTLQVTLYNFIIIIL